MAFTFSSLLNQIKEVVSGAASTPLITVSVSSRCKLYSLHSAQRSRILKKVLGGGYNAFLSVLVFLLVPQAK